MPPVLKKEQRPYRAYGGAEKLLYCKDPEVLLDGPAGTGKSRAILEKILILVYKYPGIRVLIVRKTRASLTESALVTFEEKVLPPNSPVLTGIQRKLRQSYNFPNGSAVVVGGMDNAIKIMSTEYDLIYVQEATELTENDWESLITRLRNGVLPYQQIIGDCNPDSFYHWLNQRCIKGQTTRILSRHEDNPTISPKYLETLSKLTGVRRLRLYEGKWASAEGVVYESFDRAIHVIDRFDIPKSWPRYWGIDFGFTNPFVWQAWAEDHDGRLYMYREIYMSKTLVEDHARVIKAVTEGEPRPIAIICDHDAEDRATFEKHIGLPTQAAEKNVSGGIQAVQERLRPAGDGKPRIFLMRDSLVQPDPIRLDEKQPISTVDEFDGYVWKVKRTGEKEEEPVKLNDHGLDTLRYIVVYKDGINGVVSIMGHYKERAEAIKAGGISDVLARAKRIGS